MVNCHFNKFSFIFIHLNSSSTRSISTASKFVHPSKASAFLRQNIKSPLLLLSQPKRQSTLSSFADSSRQSNSSAAVIPKQHNKMNSSAPSSENAFKLISGNEISKKIRESIAESVTEITSTGQPSPCLAVVLVGTRKDSQTYVAMKTKSCKEVNITAQQFDLPESITETELVELINKLNSDPIVNGILVQLPLPSHINSENVINCISHLKDVDGLTSHNAGELLRSGLSAPLIPCTPLGCIELIKLSNIKVEGMNAVVLGRSNLVGKPIAQLLLSMNATVTMCHSRTVNLSEHIKRADILIAAIGKAQYVPGEWLKPGCTVIDVGINAIDDSSKKSGYRLVGDCNFDQCKQVASHITPVPGGVGPMTVAMLLKNTVKAFKLQHKNMNSKLNGNH